MSVLIAYRSKYGTTRRCAEMIAEKLGGEVVLADLRRDRQPEIGRHDTVLIGGSIYAGKIQPEIPAFCERFREELLRKRVGLFICCLYEGEKAQAQLAEAFPAWLAAHAFDRTVLGGELIQERLKPLDRFLIRTLLKQRQDIRALKMERLEELCQNTRRARYPE